jgi:hypothetical protein
MLALAQAAMQNQMIDMMDYIRIEQCKSYTELLNELQYTMNKKKRDAEKQQAMMQMMQQAQMEQQLQAKNEQTMMKEDGANYRAELGSQAKIASDAMKMGISEAASPEEGMVEESGMTQE